MSESASWRHGAQVAPVDRNARIIPRRHPTSRIVVEVDDDRAGTRSACPQRAERGEVASATDHHALLSAPPVGAPYDDHRRPGVSETEVGDAQ